MKRDYVMKTGKYAFLFRLLPAVWGGGFAVCCIRLWDNREADSVTFGAWFSLALLFLLLLCLTILFGGGKGRGEKLHEDIVFLDKRLLDQEESIALYPSDPRLEPEAAQLEEHICRLAQSLLDARERLDNQERRFRYIFSSLNEGFILLDLSQRILGCNRTAQEVLGLPLDCENYRLPEVLHNRKVQESADFTLQTAEKRRFDLVMPDGNIYAVQTRMVRPIHNEARKNMLILLQDVTAERSALQQRQDFFSNASHELRTPITSILGFAEMLENGLISDPEQSAQSIRIIRREALRMSRIINDLLFISKLESNDESIESPPISVREVAMEIMETLTPDMQEKNIRMEVSGGNFLVAMPYSHLYNLLSNLMQNAVKYNVENGSVWVRIELDGDRLRIGVRDTGIGIPAEMKTRVFERFFRVDKGRSRNIGGTGLGLSIVKHLVTLYQGTITLDSALGKGSFFQVVLKCPHSGSDKQ